MAESLDEVFEELGLSQYLDTFVDQGFDSWDVILDITESDLDALGVKLGHRRKLQRRIANSRGIAPVAGLPSTTRRSLENARGDVHRDSAARDAHTNQATLITKRKYRRHPKPDENAPERPPSAYVLFSNKMRDDLKGRQLTFTEIAKLVGENWQNLSASEKEPFESQAQTAKERYTRDLADYKKTVEYTKYLEYLQDFKEKHSAHKSEKDAAKRVKTSEQAEGSSTRTSGTSRSATGSDGERQGSSDPPSRHPRLGITTIAGHGSNSDTPSSHSPSLDVEMPSPAAVVRSRTAQRPEAASPLSTTSSRLTDYDNRRMSWAEHQRADETASQRQLPPLADVFDQRALERDGFPFPAAYRSSGSPGPTSSIVSDSQPPSLRHESSSAGSTSSVATPASMTVSHPRTPLDGSLPIHVLLAGKQPMVFDPAIPSQGVYGAERAGNLVNGYQPLPSPNAQSYPAIPPPARQHVSPPPLKTHAMTESTTPLARDFMAKPASDGASLDGLGALIRAGEIVDRQPQRQ